MDDYSTPKKMKKVGDLFSKYITHFKAPQSTVETACSDAIYKITGYKVGKEQISYTVSTKTLNLKIPSVLKTEIKFKQTEILNELKSVLGENNHPNLII